jgi:hypothetical protein
VLEVLEVAWVQAVLAQQIVLVQQLVLMAVVEVVDLVLVLTATVKREVQFLFGVITVHATGQRAVVVAGISVKAVAVGAIYTTPQQLQQLPLLGWLFLRSLLNLVKA